MFSDVNKKLGFLKIKFRVLALKTRMKEGNVLPPIPEGTKPLTHQVAGHVFGRANGLKKNYMGFLENDKGNILKPVQGPEKGQREVEFYEKIFAPNCNEPALLSLKSFVPKYEGVWSAKEHPNVVYLKMEDLTKKYKHPCIMDVKIGPITYDMHADAEKIKREESKFPFLEKVGFQLVGFKVYNPNTKQYTVRDRKYLRTLDEHSIISEGLYPFFHCGEKDSKHLINSFLKKLMSIENWFLSQKRYIFIASSLLFIYDGLVFLGQSQSGSNEFHDFKECNASCNGSHLSTVSNETVKKFGFDTKESLFDKSTDLKMIDFTHAFSSLSDNFDENYLIGLRSLITHLQHLIELD